MEDSPETAPEASSEPKPKVAAKGASGGSRKKSAKVPVKGKAKKKEPLGINRRMQSGGRLHLLANSEPNWLRNAVMVR